MLTTTSTSDGQAVAEGLGPDVQVTTGILRGAARDPAGF